MAGAAPKAKVRVCKSSISENLNLGGNHPQSGVISYRLHFVRTWSARKCFRMLKKVISSIVVTQKAQSSSGWVGVHHLCEKLLLKIYGLWVLNYLAT